MKYLIIFFSIIFFTNSCSKNEFCANKNIPNKKDFDKELKTELNRQYSIQNGTKITLNWELLSDKPIEKQSSYPVYFVWIEMSQNNKVVNQGLVKLIVKDKKFHSIAFMNDERIRTVPNDASREFPLEILEKIKKENLLNIENL